MSVGVSTILTDCEFAAASLLQQVCCCEWIPGVDADTVLSAHLDFDLYGIRH